jgi:DeoR/GlpR family transcriptional regulator of sugar metabolism
MAQKLHASISWLRLKYITQGKSIEEIAKEANVVPMTIRRALESAGLIRK